MNRSIDIALEWLMAELKNPYIVKEDNFLDIGGDSLLSMEFAVFLLARAGIELDQAALFQMSIGDALDVSSERDGSV